MPSVPQRQTTIGLLLGAICLGLLLYLSGLASILRLGNADLRGFLLVPSLPIPLYVVMALVICAGVGMTLLASFLQRRRQPPDAGKQRIPEPVKTPWQVLVSMTASGTMLLLGVVWLVRYGSHLQQWWERWRHEIAAVPALLGKGTQSVLRQVPSSTTGYALFATVLVIYGGLALLGLWIIFESRRSRRFSREPESPQAQRVRRAVAAGLRELHQHPDPRRAIIACYARLEHLLEDYGVPAYGHLTPQEYMGTALRGLDLPIDAFAGLVELFEQARYSLHPLDDAARQTATIHLETIKTHLEWGAALATHA